MNCTYIMTLASSLKSSSDMHSSRIIFTATLVSLNFPSSTRPNWPLPNSWPKVSSSGSTSHWSVKQQTCGDRWNKHRGSSYQRTEQMCYHSNFVQSELQPWDHKLVYYNQGYYTGIHPKHFSFRTTRGQQKQGCDCWELQFNQLTHLYNSAPSHLSWDRKCPGSSFCLERQGVSSALSGLPHR